MFFVISGFVITEMLLRRATSSIKINLFQFYWRRFTRLIPALTLMTLAVLGGAILFMSPVGLQETTAQTAIGSSLLSANFVISQISGGYFDPSAELNPLLHTWSLSLEEQFYLFYPALLIIGLFLSRRTAWSRNGWGVIVGLVGLFSFLFATTSIFHGYFAEKAGIFGSWLLGFYSPLTRI